MKPRSVDDVVRLYADRARFPYDLSGVNQLEHALQSAQQAVAMGNPDAFVLACLLHDIGHLFHRHGEAPAARGRDDHHEVAGAIILAPLFGENVAGPVRLHVTAKRYLCAVEDGYFAKLSADSVRSLALQGGPLTDDECQAFARDPCFEDAVALRRIDEAAKEPGLPVAAFDAYVPMIHRLARPSAPSA
jgi:phosphonate degradation associated HDIG domain protein